MVATGKTLANISTFTIYPEVDIEIFVDAIYAEEMPKRYVDITCRYWHHGVHDWEDKSFDFVLTIQHAARTTKRGVWTVTGVIKSFILGSDKDEYAPCTTGQLVRGHLVIGTTDPNQLPPFDHPRSWLIAVS